MAEGGEAEGICELVMGETVNWLVGEQFSGSCASEMSYGEGMMIELEMRIDDAKEIVFPHPTVSEIIRETLFEL